MEIGETIEMPEMTPEYLNQIETSWLEHFAKTENKTISYFEFLFSKNLKFILDEFISNLPLQIKNNSHKYKIFFNPLVLKAIEKDVKKSRYKGFLLKLSENLPNPFLIFVTAIE